MHAAAYKAFFHHFVRLIMKGGLQSREVYTFYFFTVLKGINDAQSCLDYVLERLSTKLSFCILFSSPSRADPSQEGL